MNFDFQDIVLSKKEFSVFKMIGAGKDIRKGEKGLDRLIRFGLIDSRLIDKTKSRDTLCENDFRWVLTKKGTDYLAYLLEKKKEHKIETRHFWITTVIAVVALIKSFSPEIHEAAALLLKLLKLQ